MISNSAKSEREKFYVINTERRVARRHPSIRPSVRPSVRQSVRPYTSTYLHVRISYSYVQYRENTLRVPYIPVIFEKSVRRPYVIQLRANQVPRKRRRENAKKLRTAPRTVYKRSTIRHIRASFVKKFFRISRFVARFSTERFFHKTSKKFFVRRPQLVTVGYYTVPNLHYAAPPPRPPPE